MLFGQAWPSGARVLGSASVLLGGQVDVSPSAPPEQSWFAARSAGINRDFDQVLELRDRLAEIVSLDDLKSILPSMPHVSIDELREFVNTVLLLERDSALVFITVSAVFAVLVGLLLGDRSAPPTLEAESPSSARRASPEDMQILRTMPAKRAAEWDRGGPTFGPPVGETRESLQKKSSTKKSSTKKSSTKKSSDASSAGWGGAIGGFDGGAIGGGIHPSPVWDSRPVSALVWQELAICVLLDAAGVLSFFIPQWGEVSDIPFSLVYGLVIELFFDWPAIALFGFWEELLPFFDIIPTATIAWLLVTSGLRDATKPVQKAAAAGEKQSFLNQGTLAERLAGEEPLWRTPLEERWRLADDDAGEPFPTLWGTQEPEEIR